MCVGTCSREVGAHACACTCVFGRLEGVASFAYICLREDRCLRTSCEIHVICVSVVVTPLSPPLL